VQPYLFQPTADSFSLDGIVSIVSGGPRLVTDGRIDETMESAFSDQQRFGPNAASARTAVGLTPDGSLLLVSVPGATIQQMRELMLALGCEDAFNLEGGASCGMYCQGKMLATPGRALTTTLQVFLDL
jgi:exopolysaccharide biosynthesis protein